MASFATRTLNKVTSYRPQPIDYAIGGAVACIIGIPTVGSLKSFGGQQCQNEFNTAVAANPEWRARYSGFNVQTPEAKYALGSGCEVTTETAQNGTKVEQTIKWDKGSNTLVLPQPLSVNQ